MSTDTDKPTQRTPYGSGKGRQTKSLRMPPDLWDAAQDAAQRDGVSLNLWVERALRAAVSAGS